MIVAQNKVQVQRSATRRLEIYVSGVVARHFEMFRYERRLYELIDVAMENDWPPLKKYRADLFHGIGSIIRDGMASGEFRRSDHHRATAMVLDCLTLLTHPAHIRELDEGDAKARVKSQIRFLVRALA